MSWDVDGFLRLLRGDCDKVVHKTLYQQHVSRPSEVVEGRKDDVDSSGMNSHGLRHLGSVRRNTSPALFVTVPSAARPADARLQTVGAASARLANQSVIAHAWLRYLRKQNELRSRPVLSSMVGFQDSAEISNKSLL